MDMDLAPYVNRFNTKKSFFNSVNVLVIYSYAFCLSAHPSPNYHYITVHLSNKPNVIQVIQSETFGLIAFIRLNNISSISLGHIWIWILKQKPIIYFDFNPTQLDGFQHFGEKPEWLLFNTIIALLSNRAAQKLNLNS